MIPADRHGVTLSQASSEHSWDVSRERRHLGASVSFRGTLGGNQGGLLPGGVNAERVLAKRQYLELNVLTQVLWHYMDSTFDSGPHLRTFMWGILKEMNRNYKVPLLPGPSRAAQEILPRS